MAISYRAAYITLHLYPEGASIDGSFEWDDLLDTPPICTLSSIRNIGVRDYAIDVHCMHIHFI